MKLKKKDGDFNVYTIEDISYGELVAIEKGLAAQHSDPLTDEIYATIKWYLDTLPKPGEEKEEEEGGKKKKDDGDGSGNAGVDDSDFDTAPPAAPETPTAPAAPEGEKTADDYLDAPPEDGDDAGDGKDDDNDITR